MTRVAPTEGFSLASAASFIDDFTPIHATTDAGVLRLAFVVEGTWEPAAAAVRRDGSDLEVTTHGSGDEDVVVEQVRRILGTDLDASSFDEVCVHDAVLADARDRHPALRPVLFGSVYESLAWAILSQRTNMAVAAAAVQRLAEQLGTTIEAGGHPVQVFPSPDQLRTVSPMTGVNEIKAQRLRGLAEATVGLDITSERLRKAEDPLALLQQLDGVGPFSSELALIRGAGAPDVLPRQESRLFEIMRISYERPGADEDALVELAEQWRPNRSWAAFLLRADA